MVRSSKRAAVLSSLLGAALAGPWSVLASPSTAQGASGTGHVRTLTTSNGAASVRRDPCLLGTWRITDQNSLMDFVSQKHFIGATGTQTITFKKDGTSRLKANNYVLGFAADDGQLEKFVENGVATAPWSLPKKGVLQFLSLNGGTFTIESLGDRTIDVTDALFPLWTIYTTMPFVKGNRKPYTCRGNTLMLTVLNTPQVSPVTLTRSK